MLVTKETNTDLGDDSYDTDATTSTLPPSCMTRLSNSVLLSYKRIGWYLTVATIAPEEMVSSHALNHSLSKAHSSQSQLTGEQKESPAAPYMEAQPSRVARYPRKMVDYGVRLAGAPPRHLALLHLNHASLFILFKVYTAIPGPSIILNTQHSSTLNHNTCNRQFS